MEPNDNAENERISISTHRALLSKRKAITERLESRQDIAALLLINPVLALREVGVDLSPEIADHVLRALRHPPKVAAQREKLERSLEATLGEQAHPNDSHWLATTIFGKLGLQPLAIGRHQPPYADPLGQDRAWLASMRPKLSVFSGQTAAPVHGTTIDLAPSKPTLRRLDLAAQVPALQPAAAAPKMLSVEHLWFYKDASPVARELLEWLRRSSRPIDLLTIDASASDQPLHVLEAAERRMDSRGLVLLWNRDNGRTDAFEPWRSGKTWEPLYENSSFVLLANGVFSDRASGEHAALDLAGAL